MSREEMFTVVARHLSLVVDGVDAASVEEGRSMKDYGADSLEMVEVVSRSMREIGVRVPRTELAGLGSLADLLDVFERHAQSAAAA
jgi:acyl carrier protein